MLQKSLTIALKTALIMALLSLDAMAQSSLSQSSGGFIDAYFDNVKKAAEGMQLALEATAWVFFSLLASLQLSIGVVYKDMIKGGDNIIPSFFRWALSTYLAWVFMSLCFGSFMIPGFDGTTLYTYIYNLVTSAVNSTLFVSTNVFFDFRVVSGTDVYFGYPFFVASQAAESLYTAVGNLGESHTATKLMLYLLYVAILVLGLYISALFLLVSVQFYLQGVTTAYFTFFLAYEATRQYGSRIIPFTISITAKALVLIVLIAISMAIIKAEIDSLNSNDPGILSAAVGIFLTMLLCAYFAAKIPQKIESLMTGDLADSGLGGSLKEMGLSVSSLASAMSSVTRGTIAMGMEARGNVTATASAHQGSPGASITNPVNSAVAYSNTTERAIGELNQQVLKREARLSSGHIGRKSNFRPVSQSESLSPGRASQLKE